MSESDIKLHYTADDSALPAEWERVDMPDGAIAVCVPEATYFVFSFGKCRGYNKLAPSSAREMTCARAVSQWDDIPGCWAMSDGRLQYYCAAGNVLLFNDKDDRRWRVLLLQPDSAPPIVQELHVPQ